MLFLSWKNCSYSEKKLFESLKIFFVLIKNHFLGQTSDGMSERRYAVECPNHKDGHPKIVPVLAHQNVERFMRNTQRAFNINFDFVLTYNGGDLNPKDQIHEVLPENPDSHIRVRRLSCCGPANEAMIETRAEKCLKPIRNAPPNGINLSKTPRPSNLKCNSSDNAFN